MDDDMITYDRAVRMLDYLTQLLHEHVEQHHCLLDCPTILVLSMLRCTWQIRAREFLQMIQD